MGLIEPVAIDRLGMTVPFVRPPINLSATPATIRSTPPGIGEHMTAILRDIGYSNSEIAALQAVGAIRAEN